jgi:hypothetical protein
MRINRTHALLIVVGAAVVGAGFSMLYRKPIDTSDSLEAKQANLNSRAAENRDLNQKEVESEELAVQKAAVDVIRKSSFVPGDEIELADSFTKLLLGYRSDTADAFVKFFEEQKTPLPSDRVEKLHKAWPKSSIMTRGRRIDIGSLTVTKVQKSAETTVTDATTSRFVSWISPEKCQQRSINLDGSTPVYCVSIDLLPSDSGTSSACTLTIGFVKNVSLRTWAPVMNRIDRAVERPVVHPPL